MSAELHVAREAPGPWPVTFPGPGRDVRLPGWWHEPVGERRALPVVLCRPLGWEAEATDRAMRAWAEALVVDGFAVLRFDVAGAGDAPGHDEEPGRVAAWVGSIHAAVDAARQLAGSETVAVCALHLGATLAAAALAGRSDVASFVCWGAVPTGRAYVRQLRAYRLLNALPGDPSGATVEGEEAAGYRLTPATVAELSALDLRALPRPPAPHVLWLGVAADDASAAPEPAASAAVAEPGASPASPADAAVVAAWRTLGAAVEARDLPGWRRLMQEPRKSEVPTACIAASRDFLGSRHPALAPASPRPAPASERTWRVDGAVSEELVCLGPSGGISGVRVRPDEPAPGAPTVLFLTTASHHRIGPNRLWVRLGRAFAARGVPSLRFDLPAVGESAPRRDTTATHAYSRDSVRDVQAAMAAVERAQGPTRFIVVGLCSGAFLAYHTAVADPRVVGAVMVNPQTFTWREGDSLELKRRQSLKSTRFYGKALRRRETWARLFRGDIDLRSIGTVLAARTAERIRTRIARGFRPAEVDVGRALEGLVERGVEVHFVFSADDEGVDAIHREAGSSLRRLQRRPSFVLDVVDGPAHTFEQLWAQELLTRNLVAWMDARVPRAERRRRAG